MNRTLAMHWSHRLIVGPTSSGANALTGLGWLAPRYGQHISSPGTFSPRASGPQLTSLLMMSSVATTVRRPFYVLSMSRGPRHWSSCFAVTLRPARRKRSATSAVDLVLTQIALRGAARRALQAWRTSEARLFRAAKSEAPARGESFSGLPAL